MDQYQKLQSLINAHIVRIVAYYQYDAAKRRWPFISLDTDGITLTWVYEGKWISQIVPLFEIFADDPLAMMTARLDQAAVAEKTEALKALKTKMARDAAVQAEIETDIARMRASGVKEIMIPLPTTRVSVLGGRDDVG